MLRFLIQRPIAVTMTFVALMAAGILAVFHIPVSLMPDVEVPRITVQVGKQNASARELENTVINPLRRQLLQVAHMADIESETRDERGVIRIGFRYGTDMDFAFTEVNEKIDLAMNQFPRELERPRVVKASTDQIPVFYLNLTLKPGGQSGRAGRTPPGAADAHTGLSAFAAQVVRKRIEQLPDVALADISGTVAARILILPDVKKLEALHLTPDQLEAALQENHLELGSLLIRDGHYQYNVRFNAAVQSAGDIAAIYLKAGNRLLQLGDVAQVREEPQPRRGMVVAAGAQAVSLAIIKQSDTQLGDLEASLGTLIGQLRNDYPGVNFEVTRDQTKLLDYSLSNLRQDLWWGGLLALAVMFLFLKDLRSPLLIGVTLPASLVLSLGCFYLAGISLNIISLSGLVLGVGMMIDNSIIVIDNIAQHRARGGSLRDACADGAGEVLVPMLSSVLTTCAVFVPLVFLSGIAGALFYDEALSVVIGAFVSLAISVTLIPVYYYQVFARERPGNRPGWLHRINALDYEALYEKSFTYVMRRQKRAWAVVLAIIPVGAYLCADLPKSRLPAVTREETVLALHWNERVNAAENNRRVQGVLARIEPLLETHTSWIGEQQFLLNHDLDQEASEASVYLKPKDPADLPRLEGEITAYLRRNFPPAVFRFQAADNPFNVILPAHEPPLRLKLRPLADHNPVGGGHLQKTLDALAAAVPGAAFAGVPVEEHVVLRADPLKMLAYDISYEALTGKLQSAFGERKVYAINDNQQFTPVVLGEDHQSLRDVLDNAYVHGRQHHAYPLKDILSQEKAYDLSSIWGGPEGEYFPVDLHVGEEALAGTVDAVEATLQKENRFAASFEGSLFSNRQLIREIAVILGISLALLYFILAAQFESLTLPLVVLLEIPIDIFAALAFLKLCNAGINLMSLIGIIVMTGIIINDSILKIDTINQLVKRGTPLLKAILLGGRRRLKPILMTSLSTVLAMIPMLFSPGLGSELQKPLAVALIGGMTAGTLVSLYFIPLCYYYLKKKPSQAVITQA